MSQKTNSVYICDCSRGPAGKTTSGKPYCLPVGPLWHSRPGCSDGSPGMARSQRAQTWCGIGQRLMGYGLPSRPHPGLIHTTGMESGCRMQQPVEGNATSCPELSEYLERLLTKPYAIQRTSWPRSQMYWFQQPMCGPITG